MGVKKEEIVFWLERVAEVMAANREYLTELDSAIGDADHGINMHRGFDKVKASLPEYASGDIGNILKTTGMKLMSSVGGASGPLYGTCFMRSGMALAGKEELDCADLLVLLKNCTEGIVQRGKPNPGDKTMYDVWLPSVQAYEQAASENGNNVLASLQAAVQAAREGMTATIEMLAKKGRASYLGERSVGHQDPGATSSYLMLQALLDVINT
ncbi:dihydroxyacetone kinase subunit DhaL [Desulfogranum japonicum]|uniref:dihydroxyacetone kinase subunit DhaL n=1 Tax=Desulfogranum japonicum TaxID=231447 RepID=UPI0004167529|nr:dihydroxyacetone kinase subunit DhaL [Desulfogranum japonicum]